MRLKKTVDLGEGRLVVLNELRISDVRNIIVQAKNLADVDMQALLTERFGELSALLGDCIQLPNNENLDDLSFSEMQLIKEGLLEINASFLDLVGLEKLFPMIRSTDSTEPVPSSSSAVTAA